MTNVATESKPQSSGRLAWRVLILEWLGTLVCLFLGFAWLQIPDSHVWQFAFSILSGVLLVLAFCWIQVCVFRMLRRPAALAPLWARLLICLVLLGFWLLLLHWLGIARDHAPLFAGYWNSKLSPGLRYLATYPRLVSWQMWFWCVVQWLLAGLLLVIAVEGATVGLGSSAWSRIGGVWRRWRYWLAALVCGFAETAVAGALVAWKPGKGVAAQTASVLIRVGVAYTVAVLLWCFMVSLAAMYLERRGTASDSGTSS